MKMRICTLMSGSSGNAIYIETKKTRLLIDAGKSGKSIAQALEEGAGICPSLIDGLLVTHGHRDHIQGVGVMSRRYGLPVYATEGTWLEMEGSLGKISPENKKYLDTGNTLEIGDIEVEAFSTSHDSLEPVGYALGHNGKRLGIATDSGVFTTRMANVLHNVDCLVLEANHDSQMLSSGPYPWSLKKRIAGILGHLSNEVAGQALLKCLGTATRQVILAHLSEENNRPSLALKAVQETLEQNQISLKELDITIAPRFRPGNCLHI